VNSLSGTGSMHPLDMAYCLA